MYKEEEQPVPKKNLLPIKTANHVPPLPPEVSDQPPVPQSNQPSPQPAREACEAPSFIPYLPKILQSSVSRVLNIEVDGHGGFIVVACNLGHGQGNYM